MRYYLNKTNYCDFNVFEDNKLAPRSYFIPYPDRKSADEAKGRDKRYSSPKVLCLNGDWDFRFYANPSNLPDILDTDNGKWDKIDVPSCWQFIGYDKPFYVNLRYQFPYDPPKIPETDKVGKVFSIQGADYGLGPRWKDPGNEYNFVGVYRTFFMTDGPDAPPRRYVVSFLGVASCADVYLNGHYVGYTEGSHNTAEFDVTPYLHDWNNELLVVVHRWCNGSYLEDQDMFRNNGIFRDVLLRISEGNEFEDVDFITRKVGKTWFGTARADLLEDAEVTFTLEGPGIHQSKTIKSEAKRAEFTFRNLEPAEWNDETPVLYNIYYEIPGSCIRERVGFRSVEIRGDKFYVNGSLIKFHGVNHHDTDPKNGYTMSPEDIERDMKLCKEYNIDTVRTSHYPPDPYLLELCDELGIYVVDEADIETHGTYIHKLPPSYNRISDDPKWEAHYVDRAARMYQRDKLHPSIVMWSLGNEAGGTHNTDKEYEYLKNHSLLPVHYESAIHTKRKAYDVASEMYPPSERVHEIGEKKYKIKQLCDRPYFLCEYAHAMGVGPGGMEDYWKEIYNYDSLIGGCVWEMVDHAVLHEDGSYTYGGDHGEWEHDGNFCVDGMFYPDRTPSTGAKIAKFVYRPIRVSWLGGDDFEIFNTKAFTPGVRYELRLKWNDGSEEKLTPWVDPLEKMRVKIPTADHIKSANEAGKDCLLTITTIDRKTGAEAAREQIVLKENIPGIPADAGRYNIADMLDETGGLVRIRVGGVEITPAEPYTILFRAATDNDFIFFGTKNSVGDYADQRNEIVSVEILEKRMTVVTKITCKKNEFEVTDTYEAANDGKAVLVTSRLRCTKGKGNVPRFGKAFRFDERFDDVKYYGRCGESYADMKDQFPIEETTCKVGDMTEPNIKPQESGSRFDTRWASVSDGKTTVKFSAVDKAYELGIKPYSDRELLGMKHREDEKRTGTYVTVSAFQQGIGTGICGPETKDEFKYPVKDEYVLRFVISCEEA
ncbi:MAG: hypothetical protein IKG44_08470 [Mogibacterium sp.]|nr:hypothetical protein [Mogibacterium sp.]